MRIISSFHDYYDCVQRMGQDRELVYVREQEKVAESWPCKAPESRCANCAVPAGDEIIVGFCGKVYPILRLFSDGPTPQTLCRSPEEVDVWFATHARKSRLEEYLEGKSKWNLTAKSVRRYWEHYSAQRCDEALRRHRAPLCVAFDYSHRPRELERKYPRVVTIYNGCLRDIEFFRLVSPYIAFQEISMFVSNLAVPLKPIPHIDDKTMAEAKGFNKWSFRKEPTKKR